MQDRWVSYIYRYKDDDKCENAGYIKVIRTSRGNSDEARVQIGLKLYKPIICRCKVYLIYDNNRLSLFEELLIKPEEKDVISIKKTLPWSEFLGEKLTFAGKTPRDCHGMLFLVDDGDTLMSVWDDREIYISQLSYVSEEKHDDYKPEQIEPEPEAIYEIPYPVDEVTEHIELIPIPEYLQDPVDQILTTHKKLPLFIDSPFSECVKMVPQDLGKLPMANWKLGQNSFLTHAYYKYKYIMLGKIKYDNQEKCIIGVPGVYTNKEKYLANMFGFSLFVPVKRADTKTGSFGYWVWEVAR